MKKMTAILLSAMILSPTSFAQIQFDDDVCRMVGKLSKVVMQKRQEQFPESELRRILLKEPEEMGVMQHKILKYVISEAYKVPVYNTIEKQKYASRVFSNKMNGSCLENSNYVRK